MRLHICNCTLLIWKSHYCLHHIMGRWLSGYQLNLLNAAYAVTASLYHVCRILRITDVSSGIMHNAESGMRCSKRWVVGFRLRAEFDYHCVCESILDFRIILCLSHMAFLTTAHQLYTILRRVGLNI